MRERPLTRILVVDDDDDIASLVAMVLGERGGYTVQTCDSARHALEAAGAFRPDLILLDVMMPEADGVATLGALRRLPATAQTPVVFLTAMAEAGDLARYDALGSLGVIAKPFDPLALADTIERLWGRHGAAAAKRFNPEFEALRASYLAEIPERTAALQAAADAVAAEGWDRPLVEWLHFHAHRLAGSAGVYRLPQLSRAATVLEDALKRRLDGPWPPESTPADLFTLVKAVRRVARAEARAAEVPAPRGGGPVRAATAPRRSDR
jgi:CheY-like chemotaxis protein